MQRHRYNLDQGERTNVKTITPPEMNELLDTEPDLVMIDVRTPAEFSEVHATRAKNLPLDTLSLPLARCEDDWARAHFGTCIRRGASTLVRVVRQRSR
jgi:hypothetical protein